MLHQRVQDPQEIWFKVPWVKESMFQAEGFSDLLAPGPVFAGELFNTLMKKVASDYPLSY